MNQWGNDITITASVGSILLSNAVGQPNEFYIVGACTLAAPCSISLDPLLTPIKWQSWIFHYKAVVALSASTFTIFGQVLNMDQARKESLIIVVYNGSTYDVLILPDQSDLPSGVSGTKTTALTTAGAAITINPALEPNYQIFTGTGTLAAGITIALGGSPTDGLRVYLDYRCTFTYAGGNTVTLAGVLLTADQALSGQVLILATYDATAVAWKTELLEGKANIVKAPDIWELGSGTLSAQTVGTGCNASGDKAVAEGNATTASGDGSHAEGGGSVSSGIAAHAEGSSTASGEAAHAEGLSTASADYAHSEGERTEASAISSHAKGYYSVAHIQASKAFASGKFTKNGDCEKLDLFLKKISTSNAPVELLDAAGNSGVEIPTDCIVSFHCRLNCLVTGGVAGTPGDAMTQEIKFDVQNLAGVLTLLTQAQVTTVGITTVAGNIIYYNPATINALSVGVVPTIAGTKIKFIATGVAATDIQIGCYVSMIINGYNAFSI